MFTVTVDDALLARLRDGSAAALAMPKAAE